MLVAYWPIVQAIAIIEGMPNPFVNKVVSTVQMGNTKFRFSFPGVHV